jgi:hypothetical protein
MRQMGKVLNHQVAFMAFAPTNKPIYMSLWDASDGFWRLSAKAKYSWNFCYLYPTEPGEPLMIVAPHAAQMGWTESPSFLCGAPETARDVAASILHLNGELPTLPPPPHPFEKYVEYPGAHQMEPTILSTKLDEDWVNLEVYMDDFLAQTQ